MGGANGGPVHSRLAGDSMNAIEVKAVLEDAIAVALVATLLGIDPVKELGVVVAPCPDRPGHFLAIGIARAPGSLSIVARSSSPYELIAIAREWIVEFRELCIQLRAGRNMTDIRRRIAASGWARAGGIGRLTNLLASERMVGTRAFRYGDDGDWLCGVCGVTPVEGIPGADVCARCIDDEAN